MAVVEQEEWVVEVMFEVIDAILGRRMSIEGRLAAETMRYSHAAGSSAAVKAAAEDKRARSDSDLPEERRIRPNTFGFEDDSDILRSPLVDDSGVSGLAEIPSRPESLLLSVVDFVIPAEEGRGVSGASERSQGEGCKPSRLRT